MIYHKDWLIRQIEQMVDAITHLISGVQTTATWTQTFEAEQREQIEKYLRAGEICEAENWLYENLDTADDRWLLLAAEFYRTLNNMTDEYLEEHDFSREEIADSIKDICQQFDFPII